MFIYIFIFFSFIYILIFILLIEGCPEKKETDGRDRYSERCPEGES